MNIIYFIVPVALLFFMIFVAGFIWSAKRGQYDDLDTPSQRMLLDDDPISDNNTAKNDTKQS